MPTLLAQVQSSPLPTTWPGALAVAAVALAAAWILTTLFKQM